VVHSIQLRRVTAEQPEKTFIEWTAVFSNDASGDVLEDAKFKQLDAFKSLAAELKKRFTWWTTAEEAVKGMDFKGRVFLVTGANTGLGLETARVLVAHNAHVVVTVRDEAKCKTTLETLRKEAGKEARVDGVVMDLNSLRSVRDGARQFIEKKLPLHVLILNAGVMACPPGVTADGFETQLGVNHVAHHLFTSLLLPVLRASAPARIVALSSGAHFRGGIKWDDMHFVKTPYNKYLSYAQSKTANILFARWLNALLQRENARITVNALNPGPIMTDLGRHLTAAEIAAFPAFRWKTIPQGAATQVIAATAPEYATQGGLYLDNANPAVSAPHASDMAQAERLWEATEKMIAAATR